MKKSLSLILAIAMIFSVFATAAFAADSTTTMTPQQQFDALKAAGIFQGYPDGTAGLDKEMTRGQFAVAVAKLLALDTTNPPSTATFTDVPTTHWAFAYVEAAVKAGIINGYGNGKYGPDDNVTVEQLAVVMDKALKLPVDSTATIAGASSWAQQYVKAAVDAGLIASDASFKSNAMRSVLVSASYQAYQKVNVPAKGSATAAQTAANQIAVTFNKAVDDTKATFTLKKGSAAISLKSTTWNDAKTVATLEAYGNLAEGDDYTVEVSGVDLDSSTLSVKIAASAVDKIEITSDKAALTATGATTVNVGYKVSDQFGTDITKTTTLSASTSAKSVTLDGAGTATITFDTAPALDTSVVLTLASSNGKIASSTLKVGDVAKVDTISLGDLTNKDNKTLRTDTDLATDVFRFQVTAKDQYGSSVTDKTQLANDISILNSNSDLKFSFVKDGDNAYLQVTGVPSTAGTYNFYLATFSGHSVSAQVVVAEAVTLGTFTMTAPADTVAKGDSDVVIPFTAADQFGNALTKYDDINGKVTFSISNDNAHPNANSVSLSRNPLDGTAQLKVTIGKDTTLSSVLVTSMVKDKPNTSSITITLHDLRVPTTIVGLSSDTVTSATYNGTVTLSDTSDTKSFMIKDQYGKDIDLGQYGATGSELTYTIALSADDGTFDTFTTSATSIAQGDTVTLTSASSNAGTETVTAKLHTSDNKDVTGSDFSFTLSDVAKSDISSYVIDTADKLYAPTDTTSTAYASASKEQQAYASDVNIYGKTASGTKVNLKSADILSVQSTSSNLEIVAGSPNKAYAKAITTKDTDETGTIVVAIKGNNNASVSVTKNVALTDKAPAGGDITIAADDNSYVSKDGDGYVLTSAEVTALSGKFVTSNAQYNNNRASVYFEIKDQYGVASSAVAPVYYTLTVTDNAGKDSSDPAYAGGTYSIDAKTGQITVTSVKSGDTLAITAIDSKGNTKVLTIGVQ